MLDSSLDHQAENKSPKGQSFGEIASHAKIKTTPKIDKKEKNEKGEKPTKKQKTKEKETSKDEPKNKGKEKEKVCVYHKEPLSLFNETCQEPVCEQCITQGPHNSPLYSIVQIDQAYKFKTRELGYLIGESLRAKVDQLRAQEYRVNYRMSEIKAAKSIIEKDIRLEYEGIISRLESAEGQKIALLQHDISVIQRDIARINELAEQFYSLTEKDKDKLDFMLRAKVLTENAEHLFYKAFKTEITVVPYDLPRELSIKREKEAKFNVHHEIDSFKTEILWNLYEKLTTKNKELKEALNEISQWENITEKYKSESKELMLVCHFCGAKLGRNSLNEACSKNTKENSFRECNTK